MTINDTRVLPQGRGMRVTPAASHSHRRDQVPPADGGETPSAAPGDTGRAPGRHRLARLSRAHLREIVARTAADPGRWRDVVRYDPGRRWYVRTELTDSYEVWLLSWHPGQQTGFHDHGGSLGAFAVADGELQEQTVRGAGRVTAAGGGRVVTAGGGRLTAAGDGRVVARIVTAGEVRSFGPRYVHNVINLAAAPAVSVHAYSPPLPQMRRYELTAGGLRCVGTEPAEPAEPAGAGA